MWHKVNFYASLNSGFSFPLKIALLNFKNPVFLKIYPKQEGVLLDS